MNTSPFAVVHSCTSASFSGLEQYVLDLVTWQYQQGYPVELFCREETMLHQKAVERGVPVWTIGKVERPGPALWLRLRKEWNARLEKRSRILHLHVSGEIHFHIPVLFSFHPENLKTILHFHLWITHKKKDPLHWLLYYSIDEIWTSSESARAHLSQLLPVAQEKLRVVHYGRNVEHLHQSSKDEGVGDIRRELGIADDAVVGLCISRLEKIKGVRELFESFRQVAVDAPTFHLILVGGVSPGDRAATEFVERLKKDVAALPEKIRRRIHLVGHQLNCLPYYLASDFYILPSYEECMSLALLDALILGLPVVGTRAGGTPAVVRVGETGWLVAPQDVSSLERGLRDALSSENKREEYGTNAARMGLGFDQVKIFKQIWDEYHKLNSR